MRRQLANGGAEEKESGDAYNSNGAVGGRVMHMSRSVEAMPTQSQLQQQQGEWFYYLIFDLAYVVVSHVYR